VAEFNQLSDTQWRAWMVNHEASARTVTVWSRCMDVPIKLP